MLMSNIHFPYRKLWICQRHHSSQQALWELRQPLIGQSITTNPCATFSHRWDRGSHGSRSSQLWPQCSPASRCTESKEDGNISKKGSLEQWTHIRYVCTYAYACVHVHICISIYMYESGGVTAYLLYVYIYVYVCMFIHTHPVHECANVGLLRVMSVGDGLLLDIDTTKTHSQETHTQDSQKGDTQQTHTKGTT